MSFKPHNYRFAIGEHREKSVIFVLFPFNSELQKELKDKYPVAKWSASKKCWYLPENNSIRNELGINPKTEQGKEVLNKIHDANIGELRRMHELLELKVYSPNTIKTYCSEFAQLLYFLRDTPVSSLTPEQLRSYFLYCITKLRLSENVIHSRLNAIKFYFDQVLKREKFFFEEIPRPKKRSLLPKVLSKKDIAKMFDHVKNTKHLLILKLCYGMGLRVSEIVNLKITDIDSRRMLVHIQNAKGKKDRCVSLPSSVLDDLRTYYKMYRPSKYLFEGQYGGQYSIRSVQAVFNMAMRRVKINKTVGIHGLRHSYATHLLECGTDMYFIQRLLGHKNIKTTEIYAKVSNRQIGSIKSPLDDL